MNIAFVSVHAFGSARLAGFHFLARAAAGLGNSVRFFTVALSPLSFLTGDARLRTAITGGAVNRWVTVRAQPERDDSTLETFAAFSPFHPVNCRFDILNRLAEPLFAKYGAFLASPVRDLAQWADVLILESCVGIMAFNAMGHDPVFRDCRIIYRPSDDFAYLDVPPILRREEERFLRSGIPALVSCPVDTIAARLARLHANVRVHLHGLDLHAFEEAGPSPYPVGSVNAIFVGASHFDKEAFELMCKLFPEVTFHAFGNSDLTRRPNMRNHGVRPFRETAPFVKWADVGLQVLATGNETGFRHSLKVQQYSYCRLPIVGPAALNSGWGNYFEYDAQDTESVRSAFSAALRWDRSAEVSYCPRSWEQVLADLLD